MKEKAINPFETDSVQPNQHLKALILEAVENQLKGSTPPELGEALARLVSGGYVEDRAKEKIAAVMLEHIYEALVNHVPFDTEAYVRDLKRIN